MTDGWSIASTVATGTAAVFAAWAVWQSKVQAKKSQRALLLERRADFELGVLSQLAEYNEKPSSVTWADALFKSLASMLPESDVPIARACVGLPAPADAFSRVNARTAGVQGSSKPRDLLRQDIAHEILAAVRLRVGERPS